MEYVEAMGVQPAVSPVKDRYCIVRNVLVSTSLYRAACPYNRVPGVCEWKNMRVTEDKSSYDGGLQPWRLCFFVHVVKDTGKMDLPITDVQTN